MLEDGLQRRQLHDRRHVRLWRLPGRELLREARTNDGLHRLRLQRRVREMQQQLLLGPEGVLCNHQHQDGNNQNVDNGYSVHHHHHHHHHNLHKHHSCWTAATRKLWRTTVKLQLFVHAPKVSQQHMRPRVQQLRLSVRPWGMQSRHGCIHVARTDFDHGRKHFRSARNL